MIRKNYKEGTKLNVADLNEITVLIEPVANSVLDLDDFRTAAVKLKK